MNTRLRTLKHPQRGVAVVEFAFVAVILFALLFGIIEFGRLFFTINSLQEITRRAAREQAVRWVSAADQDTVKRMAVLRPGSSGPVNFPGSPDIQNVDVQLYFYNTYVDAQNDQNRITGISSSSDNFYNCFLPADDPDSAKCIKFVRATLTDTNGTQLDFRVIAPYLPIVFSSIRKPSENFLLPRSTVIMPAEALGLL